MRVITSEAGLVWVRTLQWHEVLTAASNNYPTRDYVTHPTNAMVHPSHLKRRAAEVAKPLASFCFAAKGT